MFIPNYYDKFRCIAAKCRHNCCIGWEIDIDGDTLEYYNSLDTPFGKKIRDSISFDECPHFILGKGERCPHLNENGLCDIICELGEGAICEICTEHPRFYNCFDTFTEAGLGLCCEEAARIILGQKDSFTLICQDGKVPDFAPEEELFLKERREIFGILGDRTKSIMERFCSLSEKYGFDFCKSSVIQLVELYLGLERLDEKWTDVLLSIDSRNFKGAVFENEYLSFYFENFATYLVYRHLSDGLYHGDIRERVMFCLSACLLMGCIAEQHIALKNALSFEDICDYARMFSGEVEYSDENMDKVFSLATQIFID